MSTESNPDDIDALLADLQSFYAYRRKEAAIKLGTIPVSSRTVIEALIAAKNLDQFDEVRDAAVRALMSPVHQELLREYPDLQAAALQSREVALARKALRQNTREALPWYTIWKMAVMQPSVDTYEYIVNGTDATVSRARKWVFVTTLFAFPASAVFGVFVILMGRGRLDRFFPVIGASLGQVALLTVFVAVFSVVGLQLGAAFIHWSAKRLGGTGDYATFVFASAAISTPTSVISWFLREIPNIELIYFLFSIYAFILFLMGVRAVYKLTWGMSCLATILVPLLIVIGIVLIAVVVVPLFR